MRGVRCADPSEAPNRGAAVTSLTPAQLATLEALVDRHGRPMAAQMLGTTATTLDTIEIGRAKPKTVARVAAKLDELEQRRRRS
jgi:hypothetical protein